MIINILKLAKSFRASVFRILAVREARAASLEQLLSDFEVAAPRMIASLDRTIAVTERTIERIESLGCEAPSSHKDEVFRAFSAPDSEYRPFSANEVVRRSKSRYPK